MEALRMIVVGLCVLNAMAGYSSAGLFVRTPDFQGVWDIAPPGQVLVLGSTVTFIAPAYSGQVYWVYSGTGLDHDFTCSEFSPGDITQINSSGVISTPFSVTIAAPHVIPGGEIGPLSSCGGARNIGSILLSNTPAYIWFSKITGDVGQISLALSGAGDIGKLGLTANTFSGSITVKDLIGGLSATTISGNMLIAAGTAGSIVASGDITGAITIPAFTGNICGANLSAANVLGLANIDIQPACTGGTFEGTWTVCGETPSCYAVPASNPSPSDQATGVLTWTPLSWSTSDTRTTSHDVYLGTNQTAVSEAGTGSPEYMGRFSVMCYYPVNLTPNTTYYWRIDEVSAAGITTGSVWTFTTTDAPAVLRVDAATGGGDTGKDGSDWSSECFQTLEGALEYVDAHSPANYHVWVAQGTYKPTVPSGRSATFTLRNGVAIYAGFPTGGGDNTFLARNPAARVTILSGDIGTSVVSSDNSYHVVTATGANATAVLDGCTITGGNANDGDPQNKGGGIFIDGGNPQIANCTISANAATDKGGGLCARDAKDVLVSGCTLKANTATYGGGGAAFIQAGDPNLIPIIVGSVFDGNVCGTAQSPDSYGGGLYFYNARGTVLNCLLINNVADDGGGMCVRYDALSTGCTITNCTLTMNNNTYPDGVNNLGTELYLINNTTTVTNCIFWHAIGANPWSVGLTGSSSSTFKYCDIKHKWFSDATVIESDPQFADPAGGDYRLGSGSPCIDAGINAAAAGVQTDLDGHVRRVDDDSTADCQYSPGTCGTAPIVDMGAYEYNPLIRHISQWRSARSHSGVGELSIVLDAGRTGNGSSGPTVETRGTSVLGMGVRKIQVDFDAPVTLLAPQKVTIHYRTTVGGVMQSEVTFAGTTVSMSGASTMDIGLPAAAEEACYHIRINPGAIVEELTGDNDCVVRALVGDTNGSGSITLADALLVKTKLNQPAANDPHMDLNLSGTILLSDALLAKSRIGKQALCPDESTSPWQNSLFMETNPVVASLNITPDPQTKTIQVVPGGIFSVDLRVGTDGGQDVSCAQADLLASAEGVFTIIGPTPLGESPSNHAAFNDNDPADPEDWDTDDPDGIWCGDATCWALALPGGAISSVPSWLAPYGTPRGSAPVTSGSSRWMTLEIQVANDSELIGHSFTLGTQNFTSANADYYDNVNTDGDPITVEIVSP